MDNSADVEVARSHQQLHHTQTHLQSLELATGVQQPSPPPSAELKRCDYVGGPVPCVSLGFLQEEECACYGRGPYLVVESLVVDDDVDSKERSLVSNNTFQNNIRTQEEKLLVFSQGQKVHGIHTVQKTDLKKSHDHQDTTLSSSSIAVIHGGQSIAFVKKKRKQLELLQVDSSKSSKKNNNSKSETSTLTSSSLDMSDWIWDCHFVHDNMDDCKDEEESFWLWVGMAHHVVEAWHVQYNMQHNVIQAQQVGRFRGTRRCILYSLCFFSNCDSDIVQVASGTVTNEILLWSIPVPSSDNHPTTTITTISESHVLQGHQGVIHAVCFHQTNGALLASASDDRTIRLWEKTLANDWVIRWVGWGHTARCWGVAFCLLSHDDSEWVLSCSEDGTARVWSSTATTLPQAKRGELDSKGTDPCVAVIRGSAGGSYWSVDCGSDVGSGPILAAGGNDGTVHLFSLYSRLEEMPKTNQFAPWPSDPSCHQGRYQRTFGVPDDRVVPNDDENEVRRNEDTEEMVPPPSKKKKKKKKKAVQQVLVGLEFVAKSVGDDHHSQNPSNKSPNWIRVATRGASVLELDLTTSMWHQRHDWWDSTLQTLHGVEPQHGCCMASHPLNQTLLAIGTTRGAIILVKCHDQNDERQPRVVLEGSAEYMSVQKLVWTNDGRHLLAFHVQAVRCWEIEESSSLSSLADPLKPPKVTTYVTLPKAVVTSAALSPDRAHLAVGDSRGTLLLFRVPECQNETTTIIHPSASLMRLHKKEHINHIVWGNPLWILSAGNDGCLCRTRVENKDGLVACSSTPVRPFTGIEQIWFPSVDHSHEEDLYLSGYNGNEYSVIQFHTGYKLFHMDTGGRGRTLRVAPKHNDRMTGRFSVVINAARSSGLGLNDLIVYSQAISPSVAANSRGAASERLLKCSLGLNHHNETIFDASFGILGRDRVVLVTASEDCSSRLTVWNKNDNNTPVASTSLLFPPQESGVRAICCCQNDADESSSSVFVCEGGAKQYVRFYVIGREQDESDGYGTVSLCYIADGSPSENAPIDHRINCVKAVWFKTHEEGRAKSHIVVVLAGDSNGQVHMYVVGNDDRGQTRRIRGRLVFEDVRPVLSLEIAASVSPHSLCFLVGTSGGDLCIVNVANVFDKEASSSSSGTILCRLKPHKMGTNCITAFCTFRSALRTTCHVASGGDDQSLCFFCVELSCDGGSSSAFFARVLANPVKRQASTSAIRGLRWIDANHVVCTGYAQRVSVWKVDSGFFRLVTATCTEIGDVNALATSTLEGQTIAAVSGIGTQLFTLNHAEA